MRYRDYELKQNTRNIDFQHSLDAAIELDEAIRRISSSKITSVFIPKEDAETVDVWCLPKYLKSIGVPDDVDYKLRYIRNGLRVEWLK